MCCVDTKGIFSIYWLILLCTLTHILSSLFKENFENPWIKKFTKWLSFKLLIYANKLSHRMKASASFTRKTGSCPFLGTFFNAGKQRFLHVGSGVGE